MNKIIKVTRCNHKIIEKPPIIVHFLMSHNFYNISSMNIILTYLLHAAESFLRS